MWIDCDDDDEAFPIFSPSPPGVAICDSNAGGGYDWDVTLRIVIN